MELSIYHLRCFRHACVCDCICIQALLTDRKMSTAGWVGGPLTEADVYLCKTMTSIIRLSTRPGDVHAKKKQKKKTWRANTSVRIHIHSIQLDELHLENKMWSLC